MANTQTKPATKSADQPAPVETDKAPAPAQSVAQTAAPAPAQDDQSNAASGSVETDGVRARRGLMPKQFLPDPDWINKNVVAGGKGTKAVIGRIWGIVTKTDRKTNTLPNGDSSETIVCTGVFNSEGYLTGEVAEASSVYFPMAYAEKIEAVMKADPSIKVVEVDCDVGLEATGKTIPYEWVIVAYREGAEMAVLKRLKGTRGRPASVLTAPDGSPKALPAPTKAA